MIVTYGAEKQMAFYGFGVLRPEFSKIKTASGSSPRKAIPLVNRWGSIAARKKLQFEFILIAK